MIVATTTYMTVLEKMINFDDMYMQNGAFYQYAQDISSLPLRSTAA